MQQSSTVSDHRHLLSACSTDIPATYRKPCSPPDSRWDCSLATGLGQWNAVLHKTEVLLCHSAVHHCAILSENKCVSGSAADSRQQLVWQHTHYGSRHCLHTPGPCSPTLTIKTSRDLLKVGDIKVLVSSATEQHLSWYSTVKKDITLLIWFISKNLYVLNWLSYNCAKN